MDSNEIFTSHPRGFFVVLQQNSLLPVNATQKELV